jgi:hypothetical protein
MDNGVLNAKDAWWKKATGYLAIDIMLRESGKHQ